MSLITVTLGMVFLNKITTVSSKYTIYCPESEISFTTSDDDRLRNFLPDTTSKTTKCMGVISIGSTTRSFLQNLYSTMEVPNTSLTFSDTVNSITLMCSCDIESIKFSDGTLFVFDTTPRVINKRIQATIVIKAIHCVTKDNKETLFPVFVLKEMIIQP